MLMIGQLFREYFSFTRSQRNGTMLLSSIVLFLFMAPYIYNFFSKKAVYEVDPVLLDEIRLFYGIHDTMSQVPANNREEPRAELSRDKTAGSVNLGGKSGVGYVDEAAASTRTVTAGSGQDTLRPGIDINSADTIDLMQIRGIGQVLSRRILRYRGILGGYARIEQLKEVYGIDEDRYEVIIPGLFADSGMIIPLKPLTDDFSTLLRHPYLDYDQVSQIFRLRESGKLNSINDLLQSPAFSEPDVYRLRHYLDFN